MDIIKTNFKDLVVFRQKVFGDNRGHFIELFNKSHKNLKNFKLKQINYSKSKKNVFRGMHYQIKKPQAKIIGVIEGKITDFVIDLRKNSKTFMNYFKIDLSEKNSKFLFVPKGFAHGFLVKTKMAKVVYFVDEYRFKEFERTLQLSKCTFYNTLPKNVILSAKDK